MFLAQKTSRIQPKQTDQNPPKPSTELSAQHMEDNINETENKTTWYHDLRIFFTHS